MNVPLSYSIACSFIALCLFLYGFLLIGYTSDKTPTSYRSIEEEETERLETKVGGRSQSFPVEKNIGKVVILVIDAIRYDFINDAKYASSMPYIRSSIESNRSCLFPCQVHLPTVTMPRIKAMTVGTVPNFFDIALNFGSAELHQDNILNQLAIAGKRIVFYGDDTWLKLFPNVFHRYEGTTSFFVSDFYEVDVNVTRNVELEMKRDDWDVMILHYLGLDHIGHVEGPRSSKMPDKLAEMDSIIEKLDRYLLQWKNRTGDDYLLVVCGDHGMRDSGGHGGSSLPEINIPFVTFGIDCLVDSDISQVDIAVTLSVLLELPTPRENVGKLIQGMLRRLPIKTKLEALFTNAEQLMRKYVKITDRSSILEAEKTFEKAIKLVSEEKPLEACSTYRMLLSHLSAQLVKSLTKFDLFSLYAAILLAAQALLLPNISVNWTRRILFDSALVFAPLGFFSTVVCSSSMGDSVLCNLSLPLGFVPLTIAVILSFNFALIINSKRTVARMKELSRLLVANPILASILVGAMLQVCSTASTSFIEEEHSIWYFGWVTLLALIMTKPLPKENHVRLLALMVLHRILRRLNQTGDKWAASPDLSDWLKDSNRISYLSYFTATGLVAAFYCENRIRSEWSAGLKLRSMDRKLCALEKFVDACCFAAIFVYRIAINEVSSFGEFRDFLSFRGKREFQIFSSLLACSVILKLQRICSHRPNANVFEGIVNVFLSTSMIFSSLLLGTCNVILVPSLYITSEWICATVKDDPHRNVTVTLIHYWLALMYFFYQGNWNNFSSVDVAAGYIGQDEYNQIVAGVLIVFCTYSMPILSFLFLIRHLLKFTKVKNNFVWSPADVILFLTNFHIFYYMIIATVQRHHLFIWSVLSPKLCYLAVYSIFLYVIVIILQFFVH